MANYGFKTNKLQSMFNAALIKAGVITGLTDTDVIPNGALVRADNTTALPANIYGGKDLNEENFAKFTSAGTSTVYVLDAAEVPQVTDASGNTYKVGSDLTALTFPYDIARGLRFRELALNDRFYLFDGNVDGTAPTAGQYLTGKNASFLFELTSGGTATGSGFEVVVQAVLPLTAGLTNKGNQYLCKVTSL